MSSTSQSYVVLLQALYRGNSAQVLRILPDTLIKFMVNDTLKVMFAPPDGRPIGLTGKLAAGTATGMLKCVMVYPLDLARTRMAAGERFVHSAWCSSVAEVAQLAKSVCNGLDVPCGRSA